MKQVKKFTSFEDLKSCGNKSTDYALSLKKHKEFEKVIKGISSINVRKNNHRRSK